MSKHPIIKLNQVLALLATAALVPLASLGGPVPPVLPHAALDPTAVPPPIARFDARTIPVTLEALEVIADLAPGQRAWIWTFNGTVPGPMIRCMEGDTLVITLKNNLAANLEPHNIDFHAAMGPGGGAAATNIEPGEERTFSFKAMRAGAYIYHCAGEGMPWEHVAYGMYGLIMVEPKGGLSKVDKEFYVGQSDWYTMPNANRALIGKIPRPFLLLTDLVLDEEKALAEHPDYFTFNGHTSALTDPAIHGDKIKVNQGDKVRFFFVTGGPNIGSNWHIIGQIFDKVYKGHPRKFEENEETVYVAPGSAAVFELQALVPGKYLLVDHALFRVPKGAAGFMHVMARVPATFDPAGDLIDPGSWPLDIFAPVVMGSGH